MKFIKKYLTPILITILLATMAGVMFFSSRGDSAIVDEIAHIPAGYSYITTGDYRLNPEHPPLIKDMAAIPLLLAKVKFPYTYWAANVGSVNNQWETGWKFIYRFGNNPGAMIILARIPVMLLSLFLGFLVYLWANKLYGKKAGIFALVLFVFDANIIAHSRFVTTDLGISFSLFLHMFTLWWFIKKPNWKTLLLAGFTFAVALVTKFSAAILAPIYTIVFIMMLFRRGEPEAKSRTKPTDVGSGAWSKNILAMTADKIWFKRILGTTVSFGLIALIGVALMWLFYIPHTINMPTQVQKDLIVESLPNHPLTPLMLKMSGNAVTKPLGQYMLGFLMVSSHVEGGHDAFLLGQVSNRGWWYYYPVAIALKTAIPVFIIIILALSCMVYCKLSKKKTPSIPIQDWFTETYLWVLPAVLLFMGMKGSINLGIRYMLPVYPFIFVFVSKLAGFIDFEWIKSLLNHKKKIPKTKTLNIVMTVVLGILMLWYVLGSLGTYPYYLSYYNEFVGGYKNGYKYLTNSNTDWGQDVKRLTKWVEKENIEKIYVDVFPGSMPASYYLGDKMIEWHVQNGRPKGMFAVSATFYQNSRLKKDKNDGMDYSWLDDIEPKEILGGSILIYDLRE